MTHNHIFIIKNYKMIFMRFQTFFLKMYEKIFKKAKKYAKKGHIFHI